MTKREIKARIKLYGLHVPIYVEWVDSMSLSGKAWFTAQELEEWSKKEHIIKTVGYLYAKNEKFVTLVQSSSPEHTMTGPFKIPVSAITYIAKLYDKP